MGSHSILRSRPLDRDRETRRAVLAGGHTGVKAQRDDTTGGRRHPKGVHVPFEALGTSWWRQPANFSEHHICRWFFHVCEQICMGGLPANGGTLRARHDGLFSTKVCDPRMSAAGSQPSWARSRALLRKASRIMPSLPQRTALLRCVCDSGRSHLHAETDGAAAVGAGPLAGHGRR